MINSRELREGNKVISGTHNLLNATVQNIMPHSGIVTLREVSTYDTFDKLEPIPLTPEWLERCGFEKRKPDEDYEYWGIRNFTLKYGRTMDNEHGLFLNGYHNDCYIQHLHQLQNLYFALTGEELQIKEA